MQTSSTKYISVFSSAFFNLYNGMIHPEFDIKDILGVQDQTKNGGMIHVKDSLLFLTGTQKCCTSYTLIGSMYIVSYTHVLLAQE